MRLLAYVTGSVNQELLLRNEYLAAENQILRAQLPARLRLSNPERITLAEIGKRLGRKALREIACVAKPDTILAWYRKLIAQKFDGSKHRQYPGRPPVSSEVAALVVRMARENSGWGSTSPAKITVDFTPPTVISGICDKVPDCVTDPLITAADVGPNPFAYSATVSPGFAGVDAPGYRLAGPSNDPSARVAAMCRAASKIKNDGEIACAFSENGALELLLLVTTT